jgi:hypothetical protein
MSPAYEEVVDLIARGTTPAEIVAFRPSEAALQRVRDLLERLKDETLTPEASDEMDEHLFIEHFMRLAKARARENVAKTPRDAI